MVGSEFRPRFRFQASGVLLPVAAVRDHIGEHQQMGKPVLTGFPDDMRWLASLLNVPNRLLQELAGCDDRLIRGNEMLLRAVLDRALARGSKGIMSLKAGTHARVRLGFHRFPILHET